MIYSLSEPLFWNCFNLTQLNISLIILDELALHDRNMVLRSICQSYKIYDKNIIIPHATSAIKKINFIETQILSKFWMKKLPQNKKTQSQSLNSLIRRKIFSNMLLRFVSSHIYWFTIIWTCTINWSTMRSTLLINIIKIYWNKNQILIIRFYYTHSMPRINSAISPEYITSSLIKSTEMRISFIH